MASRGFLCSMTGDQKLDDGTGLDMLIGDDSLFNDALEQKRAMRAAFTEPDYGDIELPVQSNFDDSLDLEDTQLPFGDPAITTGADGSNDDQNDSQDTTGFNADLKNETASYQVVKPTPDICGVTTTGSSAVGLESSMTDNMAADHSTTQPSSAGVTEPLTKLTTTTAASVAQLDKLVPQFCQKKKPMFGSSKSTRSKNTSKSTKKVNSSPSETLEPQPPALASLLQPLAEEQCSNKENQGNDTDQCVPQNASKMRAPLKTSFNAPKPKSSSNNKILSSDKEGENKNKSQDKKLRKKISETECDKNEEMKVELEEKRVEKKKEKSRKMREAEEKKDERDKKMKEAEEKKAERERKKKEAEGKKAEKEIKKEEAEEKKAERERLRKEAEEKTAERERLKKERQMEIEKKKTECEQKKNYKRLQKSKGDQEKKKKTVKCTSQEKSNTAPEISDNTDSRMSEKETKELVPAQGGQSEAAHTSGKMDTTDPPPLTPETESHTPAKENATTTSHSVSQSSIHSAQRSSGARGKEGDGGVIQPEENCGLPESSNLPVRSAREEGMPEEDGCESEDELSQNQPENIPPPQERANTENMGNKPGEVALGDSDQLSEDEKEPSNSPDERVNTTTSKKADEAKEENKTEEKNEAKEKNETEERNDTVPAVEPGSKTIRIVFGKSQTARSKGKMEEGNGEEERDMEEGKDGGKGKGNQKRENKYFKAPCRNHPAGITHDQREIKSFKAPCRNQPLGKNEAKTLSKDQNRKKENMRRARKRKARSIDDESSGSLESKAKCSRSHNYCGPVWVQCEQPHCLKWRQVRECSDPLSLPDSWTCSMNPDTEHSTCSAPEEVWSDVGDSQEYVESPYIPGSLVWAKMDGYPWWPAMVEEDPDKEAYYEMGGSGSNIPVRFHVVYFDIPVCRGWVAHGNIRPYTDDADINAGSRAAMFQKNKTKLSEAQKQAFRAANMPISERVAECGFAKRFRRMSSKKRKRAPEEGIDDNTFSSRRAVSTGRCRKSAHIRREMKD